MKSIERRFNNIKKGNPYWSLYLCFTEAIKNQNLSKQTLHRWFNKLVDKNDYSRSEKNGVLGFLDTLTKPLRTA